MRPCEHLLSSPELISYIILNKLDQGGLELYFQEKYPAIYSQKCSAEGVSAGKCALRYMGRISMQMYFCVWTKTWLLENLFAGADSAC